MIFVQQEKAVSDEEIADLAAAVIEDKRSPVTMFALAWIGMLVEMRTVKLGETMCVFREMAGDPVEDYADPVLMAAINKMPELVRIPETTCYRVVTGHL